MKKNFVNQSLKRCIVHSALLGAALCFPLLPSESHAAQTAYVAAADQSGGYANAVLDRVIEKWTPPQSNEGRVVRIMLMVDGDGKMTECMPIAKSGSSAADKAACDAARAVGTFATPPYGLPMDVFLSFWMGKPDLATHVEAPVVAPVGVPVVPPVAHVTPGSAPHQASTASSDLVIDMPQASGQASGQTSGQISGQSPTKEQPATEPVVIPSAPSAPAQVLERAPIPYATALHAGSPTPATQAPINTPHTSYKPTIQDARSGAVMDEKDYYVKRVMGKIGPLVVFPANMPRGKYSTSITVRVDDDGTFLKIELDDSSGIAALDAAILAAAEKTAKVHAPPSNKIEDLYLTFVVDNP